MSPLTLFLCGAISFQLTVAVQQRPLVVVADGNQYATRLKPDVITYLEAVLKSGNALPE
jgi:hypothetical protein